ncbi:hypothetical protein C8F04DRAFT_1137765 [Mycena alexandri]|uniref:F-box domain-containing protein n=1 Tax=Mycena alexandri TaxID=1745969 RepID=A0AAD6S9K4_9AGAR|nr:hypothetical protein C8F04DRAFT_1137765 [Mycena alexandri]
MNWFLKPNVKVDASLQLLVKLEGPSIRDRLRQNRVTVDEGKKAAIVGSLDAARARIFQIWAAGVSSREPASLEVITLQNYIAEYSSLFSKIRQLPDEILLLILLHPDIHDHLIIGHPSSRLSAVHPTTAHITAVCTYWRSLVLAMPVFFASLNVLVTGSQNNLSLLRLFLLRSQNAPLSIIVQARPNTRLNPAIVDAIVQQAPRWERLRIAPATHSTDFVSSIPAHLPLLETIAFGGTAVALGRIAAPRLQIVGMRSISEMNDIPDLPPNGIRQLSAHLMVGLCGKLLDKFSNVSHLTITPLRYSRVNNPLTPKPHPSVQKLTLLANGETETAFVEVMKALNLPSLEWLQLVDGIRCDSSSLQSHTHRSGCRLKTLLLRNTFISALDFVELLRALPTLETLEITWQSQVTDAMTDLVLTRLTPVPGLNILPALTKLVLNGNFAFGTTALLTMLASRLAAGSTGTSLAIIDITLVDRVMSSVQLEMFAALRIGTLTSLECLDENRKRVRVCNGLWR